MFKKSLMSSIFTKQQINELFRNTECDFLNLYEFYNSEIEEYEEKFPSVDLLKNIVCSYIKDDFITLSYQFDVKYDIDMSLYQKDDEVFIDVYMNSEDNIFNYKSCLVSDNEYPEYDHRGGYLEMINSIKEELDKIIINDSEYFLYYNVKKEYLRFDNGTDEWNYTYNM
uniref:Uncharacterized protein n=1 Tax=Pithovirus LCDPAC02 TaxID=2506601 RepID=A0A481YPY1_9VIRU|nr:MAG: hypothetical protein LCDPAC02_00440 [Pithovirus LCDPAC02]